MTRQDEHAIQDWLQGLGALLRSGVSIKQINSRLDRWLNENAPLDQPTGISISQLRIADGLKISERRVKAIRENLPKNGEVK